MLKPQASSPAMNHTPEKLTLNVIRAGFNALVYSSLFIFYQRSKPERFFKKGNNLLLQSWNTYWVVSQFKGLWGLSRKASVFLEQRLHFPWVSSSTDSRINSSQGICLFWRAYVLFNTDFLCSRQLFPGCKANIYIFLVLKVTTITLCKVNWWPEGEQTICSALLTAWCSETCL